MEYIAKNRGLSFVKLPQDFVRRCLSVILAAKFFVSLVEMFHPRQKFKNTSVSDFLRPTTLFDTENLKMCAPFDRNGDGKKSVSSKSGIRFCATTHAPHVSAYVGRTHFEPQNAFQVSRNLKNIFQCRITKANTHGHRS